MKQPPARSKFDVFLDRQRRAAIERAAEPPGASMDASGPVVVGVDPGISGGLAAITLLGTPVRVAAMPTLKLSKGSELNAEGVASFFEAVEAAGHQIVLVAIEKVHAMPLDSRGRAFNFGAAWGEVRGYVKGRRLPLEQPTPQEWQKAVLHGTAGKTKQDAIAFVRRRFPTLSLQATARSTKDHDGIADAACIAEWARRQVAGK